MRLIPLLQLIAFAFVFATTPVHAKNRVESRRTPNPAELHASSRHVAGNALTRSTTSEDTIYVFGGPGTLEGRFETAAGEPDRQGWTGLDDTDEPPYWQVSTFNASNLSPSTTNNRAMWCGLDGAGTLDWISAPGYGNNWFDALLWESPPVPNPDVGQVVDLDFVFNYDTEPGYDFFRVEYERSGSWVTVFWIDGTNKDPGTGQFPPPGVQYASTAADPIVYSGDDYGQGDRIRIRLVFESDAAYSDQDGLASSSGAVQVDEIIVSSPFLGTSLEDFEGPAPYEWVPAKTPFAGDFSKVLPMISDIDACRSNRSPAMAFIDDGSVVNNASSAEQIPGYPTSTEGSTSPTSRYGFWGGWVVNYEGGLSGGQPAVTNYAVSPPIPWTVPDVGSTMSVWTGGRLIFDIWQHLPLINAILYDWDVRSSVDGGATWSSWRGDRFAYYSEEAKWQRAGPLFGRYLEPGLTHVQVRFGVLDLAEVYSFPGNDATPAPVFDNVAVLAIAEEGPTIRAAELDLAQDGFPADGSRTGSIRFDMARNLAPSGSPVIASGDSIAVTVTPRPGETLSSVVLRYVLRPNPHLAASELEFGSVNGIPIAGEDGRFAFDLQDDGWFFPGDRLHYYIEATDTGPGPALSTLPADTTGIEDFSSMSPYAQAFTVRGLPTILDDTGNQPRLLVWKDGGEAEQHELNQALQSLGYEESSSYDEFYTNAPSADGGNGLGAKASLSQIERYDVIVYSSGALDNSTLIPPDAPGDADDDVGLVRAWNELGNKGLLLFGDNLAGDLATAGGVSGQDFIETVMSVSWVGDDVQSTLYGQTSIGVRSLLPSFSLEWTVIGSGCPRTFDDVRRRSPASILAGYLDTTGSVFTGPAAGVVHERSVAGARASTISFPYGFDTIVNRPGSSITTPTRAILLQEVLTYFGSFGGTILPGSPSRTRSRAALPPNEDPEARVQIFAAPGASGPRLADVAFGSSTSSTVMVTLLDEAGNPVVGYPRQSIWLVGEWESWSRSCGPGLLRADRDTDENGRTTFSGALGGGGSSEGMTVTVGGAYLDQPSPDRALLPIDFRTPDLNRDLSVNLVDLRIFREDLLAAQDSESDFTFDGVVDLLDAILMAPTFGELCTPISPATAPDSLIDPKPHDLDKHKAGKAVSSLGPPNSIGVYFEVDGRLEPEIVADTTQVLDMVVVLNEPTEPWVSGYDFELSIDDAGVVILASDLSSDLEVNFAETDSTLGKDFVVGLSAIAEPEPQFVLARVRVDVAAASSDSIDVFVRGRGRELPTYVGTPLDERVTMTPVSGDVDVPVATIRYPGAATSVDGPGAPGLVHSRIATIRPNPFNPRTTIQLELSKSSATTALEIYTVSGRRIRTLNVARLAPGRHSVVWNGEDDRGHRVASGVYLVRLSGQWGTSVKRAILLK